jgi:hypothetical protein
LPSLHELLHLRIGYNRTYTRTGWGWERASGKREAVRWMNFFAKKDVGRKKKSSGREREDEKIILKTIKN